MEAYRDFPSYERTENMRIMIIDDELSILKTMKKVLDRMDFECLIFQDAQEAMLAYTSVKPGAVITDLKMPSMNGIDVLKGIKMKDPNAFVIILTGQADVDSAIAAVNHGAYAFFRKPLSLENILNTLQNIQQIHEKNNPGRLSCQ